MNGKMKGYTIWFTGLSGSGKTTVANELVKRLRVKNVPIVLLDGDVIRKTLSSDLGYTKNERDKHITRVANVCHIITLNCVLNVACVISPTEEIRQYAKDLIKDFVEVYIKCPIEICNKRDVKGHYKKVNEGEIKDFVGVTIAYEEPENPDVVLETDKETVEESVDKLMKYLEAKGII